MWWPSLTPQAGGSSTHFYVMATYGLLSMCVWLGVRGWGSEGEKALLKTEGSAAGAGVCGAGGGATCRRLLGERMRGGANSAALVRHMRIRPCGR